jgi:probable phosphoglycerate mutase
MTLALIPCARTEWQTEGRILGHAALAPAAGAEGEVLAWSDSLRLLNLRYILHGPDELSTRTARLLARRLRAAARTVGALQEVNAGLWTGLTDDELRERFESAYRGLQDAPLNVSPPQGESFADAVQRLADYLRRRLKRSSDPALGLVLRPWALALLHCLLEGGSWAEFWPRSTRGAGPIVLDVEAPADVLEGTRHG